MLQETKNRIKRGLRARLRDEVVRIVKGESFSSYTLEGFEHCHFDYGSFVRISGTAQFGKDFLFGAFPMLLSQMAVRK